MNVLDLFSGIGGFSLGLERAGMETVAFCESEDYCRRVLARHWPHVPIHPDIRDLDGSEYRGTVDVVCGGFPCQAHSTAARGRNNAEDLWPEMLTVIRGAQPCYVLAENVPMAPWERVVSDLDNAGFRSQLFDFEIPHRMHIRRRAFLVAHSYSHGKPLSPIDEQVARLLSNDAGAWADYPSAVGMDDGAANRMDRLRALGNGLIPAIPEAIGRAILAAS